MRARAQTAPAAREPEQHAAVGSLWLFLGEMLLLPTGLVTAGFLTRRLGADGYGLFTLAAVIISWTEWSVSSIFSRATVQLVSRSPDWRPVGSTVARLALGLGLAVAGLVWLGAGPVARLLGAPVLADYLRLFAVDIPLFALAQAHRYILIGTGAFGNRALVGATRWIARLVLIIALVAAGLSVRGAILGSIGATVSELLLARWFVRPPIATGAGVPIRPLLGYAAPLFLFAVSLRLFDKLDLIVLKALGASAATAGFYGAAQNLSIVPGLLALSVAPVLLGTLGTMLRRGEEARAKAASAAAMRLPVLLLPFAAMAAAAAPEVVRAIFGPAFLPAAPLLVLLLFGSVALVMLSVATAVLTAAGKPAWTFAIAGPMVPLALIGDIIVVPYLGAAGAAMVTMGTALAGGAAAAVAVHRLWGIHPPLRTLARALVTGAVTWLAAAHWPASGWMLPLKLGVISLAIPAALLALGELGDGDITLLRSAFPWMRPGAERRPERAA